jgi:hypothetical protein
MVIRQSTTDEVSFFADELLFCPQSMENVVGTLKSGGILLTTSSR